MCIIFICSLPVSSFAISGVLVSNQLGSSTDSLDFYKLCDYYADNVEPTNPSGYLIQRYNAGYLGGGYDSQDMIDFFSDYVYIYYPGRLFLLNINDSIVTYKVQHSRIQVGSTYYDRLGFAWISSDSYNFKSLAQNWNAQTAPAGDNPIFYWGSLSYDYTNKTWGYGSLYANSGSNVTILQENIYNGMYDDLTGTIHYVNLISVSSSNQFATPFQSFTNIDFDLSSYVSVFCPLNEDGNCYPSVFDLGMTEDNKLGYLYENDDVFNIVPGNYLTHTNSTPGSMSSSELQESQKEYYTTRSPYTRGSNPPSSGGELGPAESEFKTDPNSEVVSAIDNLTGQISGTNVSQYSVSSTDNNLDLVDELDSAVANLSSRGNDLSSVCDTASGFFDSVFNGLPSILVAGVVCCAICLFIAKVVNR